MCNALHYFEVGFNIEEFTCDFCPCEVGEEE